MYVEQSFRPVDDEARRLFELAREKTKSGRASLFDAISDLFERRGEELDERERELMLEILRQLSREVEMSVRKKLASRLAKRTDAPYDLMVMLANDRIEVAHDILVESPMIRDAELIEVIRHRTSQHQLAVAVRKDISEDVSGALVDNGSEDVIVTLLNNPDAQISAAVMEHLVEESRRVDRYQNPLVKRQDLPNRLAAKMCNWVSAALRMHIVENFDIDIHDLDDEIAQTVGEITKTEGEQPDDDDAVDTAAQKLIDKLYDAGELSPRFAVKSLSQGQITLFELSVAKLTGLRIRLTRRIIYEPGGEGLAVACRAIGVDRAVFVSMYRLTRKSRPKLDEPTEEDIRRLVEFYDRISADDAQLVLRKWLRNPDYLAALRELFEDR